jgi:hypothetical protein
LLTGRQAQFYRAIGEGADTLFGRIQNKAYFQNEMPRTLCTDVPPSCSILFSSEDRVGGAKG